MSLTLNKCSEILPRAPLHSLTHRRLTNPSVNFHSPGGKPPSTATAIREQRSKTRQESGHRMHTKQHTQNQATKIDSGVVASGGGVD